jgi:hypothetical protein
MDIAAEICATMAEDWLATIYEKKIRSQRTRSYKLNIPKKENRADIQYTLLGIELKVGRKRFACPDLATARYLRVFARIGCNEFAVPYDITKISPAADEIETSWQRSLVLLEKLAGDDAAARSALLRSIRNQINKIGPGDAMPLFDRETKQGKPA